MGAMVPPSRKSCYNFRVVEINRVLDGDTIDVTIDLGFRITTFQRLRLVSVDTPEIRGPERPEGLKVKEYVKGLIEGKEHRLLRRFGETS